MKRIFYLFLLILVFFSCVTGKKDLTSYTNNQLYINAVRDSVFVDSDEIYPLISIEKNNDFITWNEQGDKVLLLSWNKYPDSYLSGSEVTMKWGEVWCFTDKELIKWYKENKNGVTNWTLRFEQLIGLPENNGYTHFSAFWVNPKDIIRPAYVYSVEKQMSTNFDQSDNDFIKWYKSWFNENIIYSYFDSSYPWTRLGYTYDWANNGVEYGLSEFLILKDSIVQVEFTKSNSDFIKWLNSFD